MRLHIMVTVHEGWHGSNLGQREIEIDTRVELLHNMNISSIAQLMKAEVMVEVAEELARRKAEAEDAQESV